MNQMKRLFAPTRMKVILGILFGAIFVLGRMPLFLASLEGWAGTPQNPSNLFRLTESLMPLVIIYLILLIPTIPFLGLLKLLFGNVANYGYLVVFPLYGYFVACVFVEIISYAIRKFQPPSKKLPS